MTFVPCSVADAVEAYPSADVFINFASFRRYGVLQRWRPVMDLQLWHHLAIICT